MTDALRAKDVFLEALDLPSAERDAFLAEACAGDTDLRARVDALLSADGRVEEVLGVTAEVPGIKRASEHESSGVAEAVGAMDLNVGDRIGPFLLEEELGIGGFGVVFRASQEQPVKRQVALKVIKLGMDTASVMARFELERQALALMDHPNIARVYDAGATDAGRPYFVMELVKGVPITEHCVEHRLGLDARLRLFATVCRAVQHAHQRGVLHRDIKPSNVLISQVDGHDHPKVIDFGIAKATREDVTDVSLVTREGFLLGTPDCMSPEQAEGAVDIDTRADVYALGVLLYELLCGERPFDIVGESLLSIVRIIREEVPKRPSVRQSTRQAGRGGGEDNGSPAFAIPQELDWLVMCCLEKERDRRYATASELANEVERFLADEPLLVAPPSNWYLMSKLMQRHRAAATAVIGISLALVVGAIGTGVGLMRAERLNVKLTDSLTETSDANKKLDASLAETQSANAALDLALDEQRETNLRLDDALTSTEQARDALDVALVEVRRQAEIAEAVNAFLLNDLLGAARPTGAANQGPDMPVRQLVDVAAQELDVASLPNGRFAEQPLVEAALRYTLGTTYDTLGSFEDSVRHMARCVELRREHLGEHDVETLEALSFLGNTEMRRGAWASAMTHGRDAYEGLRESQGLEHPDTLAAAARLATVLRLEGLSDEAFSLLQEARPVAVDVLGGGAPITTDLGAALAIQYADRGRFEESEVLYRSVVEAQIAIMGPSSPVVLNSKMNLATLLRAQRRYAESMALYLEAIEVQRRVEGDDHPNVLLTLFNITECLRSMGKLDEAEKIVATAVPTAERVLGPDHPKTLLWLSLQAGLQGQRGKSAAAESTFRDLMARTEKAHGPEHPSTLQAASKLAAVLNRLDRVQEAHDLYATIYQGWVSTQGADGPQAIVAQLALGSSERELGDYEAAAQTLHAAYDSAVRAVGEQSSLTWEAAALLSLIYSLRDEPTLAEPWVERAAPLAGIGTSGAEASWNGAVQQLAASFERAGDETAAQRWWKVAQGEPVR